MEIYCGLIQWISCLYVLPVVPFQMKRVGYDETSTIISTAATCAIGCIVASVLVDMPLIIAPPTSVSIFLAVSMQQQGLNPIHGNAAVMLSGVGLFVVGAVPPLGRFITKVSHSSFEHTLV
jgi:xanthine/uracil/vitamin C permease (AzgA family)